MAKLCIFLAVAVSAIVIVHGENVVAKNTPVGDQHPLSPTKSNCTAAQKQHIIRMQIHMRQCISEIVKSYLGEKNTSFTCTVASDLKTKWHQPFVNATSCYKDKIFNVSLNFFHNLLNFTTSNSDFKDFIHHNGTACVSDIITHTNQCIMNVTGVQNVTGGVHNVTDRRNVTQPSLYLLNLDNKEACGETTRLKDCVVNLMKTKKCHETGSRFISSISDFVKKQLCNGPRRTNATRNSATFIGANVILTALAALALV
uniref:Uncharacterized protein n=1 Tax=Pectinophora gossypiella TaxID=13191 RepID=A0A1E1WGR3_PECGO